MLHVVVHFRNKIDDAGLLVWGWFARQSVRFFGRDDAEKIEKPCGLTLAEAYFESLIFGNGIDTGSAMDGVHYVGFSVDWFGYMERNGMRVGLLPIVHGLLCLGFDNQVGVDEVNP